MDHEPGESSAPLSARVDIVIEASPEIVYDLVTDITRMGEWSPECYRCAWLSEERRAVPGARFRGWNQFLRVFRWSRVCEVLTADPGRLLSFRTVPKGIFRDSTRWTFELTPEGDGTRLTQSYALEKPSRPVLWFDRISGHPEALEDGMNETLARIKETAERSPP